MLGGPLKQPRHSQMSSVSEPGQRAWLTLRGWLIDGLILLAATVATYAAADWDRPVTAVLVYLTGVTVIGARSGLYRGMAAALLASFIYNFFLSEPRFRLGVTSVDELVPLIAFNLSAFVSGGLAGRLQDSARAARTAEAKNALLLAISDDLQRAVTVNDVARIASETLPLHQIPVAALSIWRDNASNSSDVHQTLLPLVHQLPEPASADEIWIDLSGSRGNLGSVAFSSLAKSQQPLEVVDLRAVANLLAIAIDRCLLLEQLSEAIAIERSEKLKDALLSSVSHDLRTPLTAIEAAATSLRSFRINLSEDQQDEMLGTIASQCQKLNRYTSNLLDMGRIQAGIAPDQLAEIDVVEILGVALGSLRSRFPDQPLNKRVQADAAVVLANAAMLEQVLVNILENAIVHGGRGKPVTVTLTQGLGFVELSVSDRGPGIDLSESTKVFERFYRGQQTIKREGSGLGLYIARGFVEAFNGTVSIGPAEHESGTIVTVRLPLAVK